jgi:DNA-directed RNA polymerase subunit RPC12/RpoP
MGAFFCSPSGSGSTTSHETLKVSLSAMKKCTYCGRENPNEAVNCSGCGLAEFEGAPADGAGAEQTAVKAEDLDELVQLTTCRTVADADLTVATLDAAGIKVFSPDQNVSQTFGFDPGSAGIRLQVRRGDYQNASELIAAATESDPLRALSPAPDGKKVVAALVLTQMPEALAHLNQQGIAAEARTVADENGVETGEILVEDALYDRACDILEAWAADQQAKQKLASGIDCRECGSRNCERVAHDKLDFVYKCQDCGNEFLP